MSPSTYLLAVPLGVIAISGWLVKVESDSFSTGVRTSGIQQIPQHSSTSSAPTGPPQLSNSPAKLSHLRYGWADDDSEGVRPLGEDIASRPLGGRPRQPADWLEKHPAPAPAAPAGGEFPPIPGFLNVPAPNLPFFETVPADSGFHIAADEATKMDMEKQTVTFNGHVKLASPQFHLTASKMVVHLSKDKKSFRLMEASGDVDVQLTGVPDEKRYRGQAGFATYDPGKGTLTLTGWPKIQGSGQELVAAEESTRVVLIPKTGKMVTEGRSQTRVAKRLMEEARNTP